MSRTIQELDSLFNLEFSAKLLKRAAGVEMAQRMLILPPSRCNAFGSQPGRNLATQLDIKRGRTLKMKSKQLRNVMLAALGLSVMGAPLPVYAATSASVSVSSMYLWRGMTISGAGPAVSGDIYFNHDSGLYAGIWTSSEGAASEGFSGSQETDLNVGFSKKFGDAGFDIGVYEYLYPEKVSAEGDSLSDTDASEFYLGGSFGPVSAKLFVNTEESENMYLTIDGTFGSFGAHVGSTMNKDSGKEYIDFNVSYMPVANLTWTISMASGDGVKGHEDPLFVVAYKWPFDIK